MPNYDVRRGGTISPLAPVYFGPYRVLHAGPKVFLLEIGAMQPTVSVDRLKPHSGQLPVTPAAPAKRGRPKKYSGLTSSYISFFIVFWIFIFISLFLSFSGLTDFALPFAFIFTFGLFILVPTLVLGGTPVEAWYSFRVCFSNPGDCKKIHQT